MSRSAKTPRRRRLRADAFAAAIFVALALVPHFAGFGTESYLLALVTRVMIFAIAAIGLDLLVGFGALVSFGHAAFVGAVYDRVIANANQP